jgi:hypothetical protein
MKPSVNRRQWTLAIAAWCSACAWGADDRPTAPAESDLADEFRRLRQRRGHFEGGAWNDELDRWQGRKHQVMQQLAVQMLRSGASAQRLRQALGEPDAVLKPGTASHERAVAQAQWQIDGSSKATSLNDATVLWLYRWRGAHDQLALALSRDHVVATAWLLDWE